MEGAEAPMQKGIKADYLEHPNHSAAPLLRETGGNAFPQNF